MIGPKLQDWFDAWKNAARAAARKQEASLHVRVAEEGELRVQPTPKLFSIARVDQVFVLVGR